MQAGWRCQKPGEGLSLCSCIQDKGVGVIVTSLRKEAYSVLQEWCTMTAFWIMNVVQRASGDRTEEEVTMGRSHVKWTNRMDENSRERGGRWGSDCAARVYWEGNTGDASAMITFVLKFPWDDRVLKKIHGWCVLFQILLTGDSWCIFSR